MLTLITGTPGAGKTAWLVQELTRLPAQRKIYVHGIPDLKIAHEPIYCTSQLCEFCGSQPEGVLDDPHAYFVEDWMEWATDGSLIVVDEVQFIWRPSSGGVPESIAGLETHRHRGLDFWLISQGPHLFHSNIRLLIGRHIHLVASWRGRSEYEWPECRQNVTSRSDAIIRPYTLPKKVFSLYRSASLHTKLDKRKPLSVYVFAFCILAMIVGGVFMYFRISKKFDAPAFPVDVTSQPALAGGGGVAAGAATVNALVMPKKDNQEFPDFTPKIDGVLESAPAYAPLLKVKSVPLLYGCIYSIAKDKCSCYTQQATPYPTSKEYCMETVKNHRFNPYFERVTAQSSDNAIALNSPPAVQGRDR